MSFIKYGSASKQTVYRADAPISNGAIAHYAPSVMATEAHHSRGDKYAFIPTIQVLDSLRQQGFQPYEVRQTLVRKADKRMHTRHMVRMRHDSSIIGAEVPEIILLNSHDGSSSYQIMGGIFRFICSNGMIAGDISSNVRIRHSGNVSDDVIEGSFRVLDDMKLITSNIDEYKQITLDYDERRLLAKEAVKLRWDEQAPINADQVLRPRRHGDYAADLWTVTNVIQENLIQGGLRGKSANGRRTSTRAVGGINENVKLNRALWSLADGMAKLKQDQDTDAFINRHTLSFVEA
jgi:hypothetical protein